MRLKRRDFFKTALRHHRFRRVRRPGPVARSVIAALPIMTGEHMELAEWASRTSSQPGVTATGRRGIQLSANRMRGPGRQIRVGGEESDRHPERPDASL